MSLIEFETLYGSKKKKIEKKDRKMIESKYDMNYSSKKIRYNMNKLRRKEKADEETMKLSRVKTWE
jgi:hypothetical protein